MSKTLPFTADQLEQIIAQFPTPFHLYDEKGIRNAVRDLYRAFSWNSGFKEYFAVKATPNPEILRILGEEGCGLDCSSMTELMLADALGFSGDGIMFSSNATPADEFIYARKLDALINLDDFSHISFLEKNGGIPETISCRFNPGGDFGDGNKIMGNPGDAKYGFTLEQLIKGYPLLAQKSAKRFGIHAFLASNMTDPDYYPTLARTIFETVADIYRRTGIQISFVNLSGGIGIPYRPDQSPVDIFAVGQGVKEAYDAVFAPLDMAPAIFTELGRYITGPYGFLVTTAMHQKDIYKTYIGLDACAVNLMRPAMYGAYHHITVMGKESMPSDQLYDITGSLCENNDKFAIDRLLPKIEIGDRVVIHDTGAHGFSMGYNYNGKLRSAEVLLGTDGSARLIRRAETPADYFVTFDFMPLFKK